jgi:hypothetical protein
MPISSGRTGTYPRRAETWGRRVRFAWLLSVTSAACVGAHPPSVVNEAVKAQTAPATSAAVSPGESDLSTEAATTKFRVERSLGATCTAGGSDAATTDYEAMRGQVSCIGRLPKHVVDALSNLPQSHPRLTPRIRQKIVEGTFPYRAVPGLGQRADVIAILDEFDGLWVRTFEGPDPRTTVLLVFGPIGERYAPLLGDYRLYRIVGERPPVDVSNRLMPKPPTLMAAERARYGPYIKEYGDAENSDLVLSTIGLSDRPHMVWQLAPPNVGDYYPPLLPDRDPRLADGSFHFGFVVWNGRRFELRKKIRYTQWSCLNYAVRSDQPGAFKPCAEDREPNRNPFVIDDRDHAR